MNYCIQKPKSLELMNIKILLKKKKNENTILILIF